MKKVLVPIDGSENAIRALEYALDLRSTHFPSLEIVMINVQAPIHLNHGRLFVNEHDLAIYYNDESEIALKSARAFLQEKNQQASEMKKVGPIAETICQVADEEKCDSIIMGTRGLGKVKNIVLGSVSTKVISLCNVPITLVK
ncbi:universal stress protein [Massilibacterium senegalense]|uniref:universal stress protein n=1 Tax=Massilibacterium senegalense TaxID=1632858 RepID=UPI00078554EE|nr:universal stress protein [Massilibacterium senegalense]